MFLPKWFISIFKLLLWFWRSELSATAIPYSKFLKRESSYTWDAASLELYILRDELIEELLNTEPHFHEISWIAKEITCLLTSLGTLERKFFNFYFLGNNEIIGEWIQRNQIRVIPCIQMLCVGGWILSYDPLPRDISRFKYIRYICEVLARSLNTIK